MRTVRNLSLPAAGFLILAIGAPALAQEGCDHGNPNVAKLVGMFMEDDKTTLVDSLVSLETVLDEARAALDDADLKLYETKIDAASALLAAIDSERALKQADIVRKRAVEDLQGALAELDDLRGLPPSQEINSDIGFMEAELVTLRRIADAAQTDYSEATRKLTLAQRNAESEEAVVGAAEHLFIAEKHDLGEIEERVIAAHRAFDEERGKVETLLATLSEPQRVALQVSLEPVVKRGQMPVNIDAEHLQTIRDEDYSAQQIAYFSQALHAEAQYRQIAAVTGDNSVLYKAAQEKQRFMAEIERLAVEKFDAAQGGKSAFGIASHPGHKTRAASN